MPLATLSVDMVAKLAKLEEGFDKAARLSEKNVAAIEKRFAGLENVAKGVGTAVGTVFAGLGLGVLASLSRGVINGVDGLNDLRDATGSSIGNLSALEDIALRTGTSFDTVGAALVKLNQGLGSAKEGDDFSRTLQGIGLSVEELKRLDPAEALQKVAVAFKKYGSEGDVARAVQELFGKSIREVAPFLNDLAEAGTLNATVTAKQAAEAEKLNKQIFALQKNLLDTAREVSSVVVPIVNSLGDAFSDAGSKTGELGTFASIARTISETVAILVANIKFVFEGVGREIGAIAAQIAALARFDLAGFRAISDAVKADGERARAELDKLEKRIFALRLPDLGQSDPRELARRGRGPATTLTLRIPDRPDKPDRAARQPRTTPDFVGPVIPDTVLAAFKRLENVDSRKIADLNEQLRVLISARAINGGGATDEAILQVIEELEKFSPEAQKAAADLERLNELLGQTESSKLEQARSDMQFLAEALTQGKISVEQFNEAATARLGLKGELAETKSIANELGLTFSSAFEDAIVGGKRFSDVLKGLEQDIIRIVTRQFVTKPLGNALTEFLGGLGKSGGGGGGGGIGAILSSLFAGKFAEGGFIPPSRWGLVGERGPELAFGGRTGVTVQPSAPGRQVVQHFHYHSPPDRRSALQIGADAARGLARAQRNT